MTQDSEDRIEDRDSPSTWSRLPDGSDDDSSDSSEPTKTDALANSLRAGLDKASLLIESGREEFDRLIGRSDLPELGGQDPLTALGVRLDREADLWRAFALGELSRAAWVDRLVQAVSVLAFLGTLALAVVGWAGAMLGPAEATSRVFLVGVGVLSLAVGAGIVSWIGATVRNSHQKASREALIRADLAELRLHRVAVVMALRAEGDETYQDALVRLERDTSAPSK